MPTLYWHEFGQGEMPVLFLHGFMGSGEEWRPIIEALSRNLRPGGQAPPAAEYTYDSMNGSRGRLPSPTQSSSAVPGSQIPVAVDIRGLCPDLPGHGRTRAAKGKAGYAVEPCIEALLRGLDERGVARCPVVGYSMGGRVALQLAIEHPERVQRLVLESASPGIEDEAQRAVRRARDEQMAEDLRALENHREGFRKFLDEWYRQSLFASLQTLPELRAELVEMRLNNRPDGLAESILGMGAAAQPSLWNSLDALICPTLLIVGTLDRKYRQIGEQISESHPSIAIHEIDECGHNVHVEKPAAYTTVLRQFLFA